MAGTPQLPANTRGSPESQELSQLNADSDEEALAETLRLKQVRRTHGLQKAGERAQPDKGSEGVVTPAQVTRLRLVFRAREERAALAVPVSGSVAEVGLDCVV